MQAELDGLQEVVRPVDDGGGDSENESWPYPAFYDKLTGANKPKSRLGRRKFNKESKASFCKDGEGSFKSMSSKEPSPTMAGGNSGDFSEEKSTEEDRPMGVVTETHCKFALWLQQHQTPHKVQEGSEGLLMQGPLRTAHQELQAPLRDLINIDWDQRGKNKSTPVYLTHENKPLSASSGKDSIQPLWAARRLEMDSVNVSEHKSETPGQGGGPKNVNNSEPCGNPQESKIVSNIPASLKSCLTSQMVTPTLHSGDGGNYRESALKVAEYLNTPANPQKIPEILGISEPKISAPASNGSQVHISGTNSGIVPIEPRIRPPFLLDILGSKVENSGLQKTPSDGKILPPRIWPRSCVEMLQPSEVARKSVMSEDNHVKQNVPPDDRVPPLLSSQVFPKTPAGKRSSQKDSRAMSLDLHSSFRGNYCPVSLDMSQIVGGPSDPLMAMLEHHDESDCFMTAQQHPPPHLSESDPDGRHRVETEDRLWNSAPPKSVSKIKVVNVLDFYEGGDSEVRAHTSSTPVDSGICMQNSIEANSDRLQKLNLTPCVDTTGGLWLDCTILQTKHTSQDSVDRSTIEAKLSDIGTPIRGLPTPSKPNVQSEKRPHNSNSGTPSIVLAGSHVMRGSLNGGHLKDVSDNPAQENSLGLVEQTKSKDVPETSAGTFPPSRRNELGLLKQNHFSQKVGQAKNILPPRSRSENAFPPKSGLDLFGTHHSMPDCNRVFPPNIGSGGNFPFRAQQTAPELNILGSTPQNTGHAQPFNLQGGPQHKQESFPPPQATDQQSLPKGHNNVLSSFPTEVRVSSHEGFVTAQQNLPSECNLAGNGVFPNISQGQNQNATDGSANNFLGHGPTSGLLQSISTGQAMPQFLLHPPPLHQPFSRPTEVQSEIEAKQDHHQASRQPMIISEHNQGRGGYSDEGKFKKPIAPAPHRQPHHSILPSSAPPSPTSNSLYVNGKPYTILSLLGRGGSSIVYQVLDLKTSNLLAIKCVNLSMVDHAIAKGYLNEIELLSKLQGCPCVITMFDHEYIHETKTLYVVMEKGDVDLSKLIRGITKTQQLSMSMIIYYWTEMLTAVKEIHDRGIIHSDLKPANFLLVSGRLKLIDFGIASSLQGDMTSVLKQNSTGTSNYISPEAVRPITVGQPGASDSQWKISYKSDVWSLGCILYNLIYGRTPFSHVTRDWVKLEMIADPEHTIKLPPVNGTSAGARPITGELRAALEACLVKDPRSRPTVAALLALNYHLLPGPDLQSQNLYNVKYKWSQQILQEMSTSKS
ncbi:hypothetical protein AAG570_009014 [Ranatra chinensis]|uniref:Protein kinase domain-containing protein n=1 Tax=Ranatra chinensis TaxID=642074 RepID=A0ABD0Z5E5_9HEMI